MFLSNQNCSRNDDSDAHYDRNIVPINDFDIHFDATIDNEFDTMCTTCTMCTMIFDTVIESNTIEEED